MEEELSGTVLETWSQRSQFHKNKALKLLSQTQSFMVVNAYKPSTLGGWRRRIISLNCVGNLDTISKFKRKYLSDVAQGDGPGFSPQKQNKTQISSIGKIKIFFWKKDFLLKVFWKKYHKIVSKMLLLVSQTYAQGSDQGSISTWKLFH